MEDYQETFLKELEKRHKINNGKAKSYLIGISAKLWKNYVRKNSNLNRIAPIIGNEKIMKKVSDHGDVLDTLIHDVGKT